ncbi:hypothetical protein ACFOSV_03105 [Algoriphagus namhaensis]|uniref:Lipoprotein n=1 Tax=Algoriphagus namhaensis TaxID=915353 RepID=A0ABV8AND6_9BACT
MKKFFLIFFLLPLISCAENDSPNCLDSELGTAFPTRINQTTNLCSEDVSVTFLEALNESRCPSDVTCIWAGFVHVKLELKVNGKKSEIELSSNSTVNGVPATIDFESFKFILVDVLPYPSTTAKIDGNKREVILTVEKIGS